jgi:hypothetical protein
LQRGQFAVLGVAFDGADRLAVKTRRGHHAGRNGMTGAVGIMPR